MVDTISNTLADYLVRGFMTVIKSSDEELGDYELNIVLTT
jgi:hypothetical protein